MTGYLSAIATIAIASVMGSQQFFNYYVTQKSLEEKSILEESKMAVFSYYDKFGTIPANIADLEPYMSSVFPNKTTGQGDFVLHNTSFSYSGNPYQAAIVAGSYGGMLTSFAGNVLVKNPNEKIVTVSDYELSKSLRNQTLLKVNSCNSAQTTYNSVNGSFTTIPVLIANNYLSGENTIDSWGNTLITSGGTCYSTGVDGVDDSRTNDDIL